MKCKQEGAVLIMNDHTTAMATEEYVTGDVQRFDQKNDMYKRTRWQPEWRDLARKLWVETPPQEEIGFSHIDRAMENAFWYVESGWAQGIRMENWGLYSWEPDKMSKYHPIPSEMKYVVKDPVKMATLVKKVAREAGADLVGIGKLNTKWVYSRSYNILTRESKPLELPPEIRYVVAFAVEMDYDMIRTSPSAIEGAAAGLGYSQQAYTAAIIAEFIRNLGYKALPTGNDTALSVPLAIDAGLGELGRNGIIITPKYGPRVRLGKVLTDLPLQTDPPLKMGVTEFCERCGKCARNCPGQAIQYGKRTDKPLNISTSAGVMKWPVDAEKCLSAWAKQEATCANCIRVCPFNKESGWLHDVVRWSVRNTPWLDPLFLKFDDALGYHKQLNPDTYWERIIE